MEMEEFYIDCDGYRLHAKLERTEKKKRSPLCILIHGFTGDMEEDHLLAVRDVMIEAGLSVLRVEMYGHGGSDGKFEDHTLYKWITNALAVIRYAKTLKNVSDLYLCGHSQGGLLTMLLGGMCADELKAIIPLSPAWMIPGDARRGSLLGVEFDPEHIPDRLQGDDWELSGDYIRVAREIHVEDEIARYTGPVLIIHGVEDETVPYSVADAAFKMYDNAKLVPIPGAGHCFEGHLEELSHALKNFFVGRV